MHPEKNSSSSDVDPFLGLAFIIGFFIFIGVWIASGSFWGALFFTFICGPTLSGIVVFVIGIIGMFFDRHEE